MYIENELFAEYWKILATIRNALFKEIRLFPSGLILDLTVTCLVGATVQ